MSSNALKAKAEGYMIQGEEQLQSAQYDKAVINYNEALKIYEKLNSADPKGRERILSKLALAYMLQGEYESATKQ